MEILVPRPDVFAAVDRARMEGVLDRAEDLVEDLESKWSRFRPTSELSRLNAERSISGLSVETYALIEDSRTAWRLTNARFDPTVYNALLAAGYDQTFDDVVMRSPRLDLPDRLDDQEPNAPVAGPVGIEFDPDSRSVTLPDGVSLDLGGIGKGKAADLLADQLLREGLEGFCINFGGDVRVVGRAPGNSSWIVAVDDPFAPDTNLMVLALADGAVATSSRTRRTWTHDGRPAHHLIDPATGRPARSGLASVTVIANRTEWAEVLAKAAFVAGPELGAEVILDGHAVGMLVTDSGVVIRTAGFVEFEVGPAPAGERNDQGMPR